LLELLGSLAEEHVQNERNAKKKGAKERKNKEGKIRKKDVAFLLTNTHTIETNVMIFNDEKCTQIYIT
jgi:hypothetical protein